MNNSRRLQSVLPLAAKLAEYRREYVAGDLIAGTVVAIMLVPQAMAYAMLAGLPPQIGLYASILPLVLYSLFGTSNTLAVGPVAMVSLLVVSGVGELATPGSPEFISLCLTLALLVGVLQILMAIFRMGFLVNFISHPVLMGFTSAAAIVIGFSQLKHLFGVKIAGGEYPWQLITETLTRVGDVNPATLGIGLASIAALLAFARLLGPGLKRLGVAEAWSTTLARTGPLFVVVVAATVVFAIGLHESRDVAVVGEIPAGLPSLTMPDFSLNAMRALLPLALVITLVGYLESISVAKALASRRREKVDPNRELLALGLADVGAAFTGGYPVTGGFSRSLVNFTGGARTPLASLLTAGLVALSVAMLTPWFYYIPNAVLGAIIIVAVAGLVDLKTPFRLWRYSRPDAIALTVTFAAVLGLGIETGILVGVVSTIAMVTWNISRPHIAEVGRIPGSEHFRNVTRHDVQQVEGILAIRIDESLNFANAPYVESYLMERIADRPGIDKVLLIASGINEIDATGIEVLETIYHQLTAAKIDFYLSDVKGPVMDRLRAAGFDESFLNDHVYLSAHLAMTRLSGSNQPDYAEATTNHSESEGLELHESI